MSITRFNKGSFTFDVNLKEVKEWKKCKDLIGSTVKVLAVGVHKSQNKKYGNSVFMITSDMTGVNLPGWYEDTVKEIIADDESVNEIKCGNVYARFNKYETSNGETVGVEYLIKNDNVLNVTNELPF